MSCGSVWLDAEQESLPQLVNESVCRQLQAQAAVLLVQHAQQLQQHLPCQPQHAAQHAAGKQYRPPLALVIMGTARLARR